MSSYEYKPKQRDKIVRSKMKQKSSWCEVCDTPFSGKKCPKCGLKLGKKFVERNRDNSHKRLEIDREEDYE